MGEFFQGWRRKIGMATLALACLFMAGSIRSHFQYDYITIPFGDTAYWIASMGGELDFCRSTTPNEPELLQWFSMEPLSMDGIWRDSEGNRREIDPWWGHEIEWRWDWGGFHFGVGMLLNRRDQDAMIPYWAIIIPLTLLSARLLLSTPRTPIAKADKNSERITS